MLLYVHFNKYNRFSEHVRYQLRSLKPLFTKVVFISNSIFPETSLKELIEDKLIDIFIQRENKGYDFAAWRDGFETIGFENLSDYSSITIMNDTCFGPLWNIEDYYRQYEQDSEVDFWGMTNHAKMITRETKILEHIQSYFISFKSNIIKSTVFKEFWSHVESFDDVQLVIDHYETKCTDIFIKAGFRYATVLNTIPIHEEYEHRNFTIPYPHILLDNKVPFIKIKAFDLSQDQSPYILKAIEERTTYPVELILNHMTDVSLPTPAYLLNRKLLNPSSVAYSNKKKIAVHLHTYYVDLLPIFLEAFDSFGFVYDLFLTTDTEIKKAEIEEILILKQKVAKVILIENKERDILPMLMLKEELSNYDYIGHFHTKKSPEYPYWIGDSWRDELLDMLVSRANELIANFEQNPYIGLAIADMPSFFRYNKVIEPWKEKRFAKGMNELWERMNLKRSIDFEQISTFIMSYGNFIWFKYDALRPIFDLDWAEYDTSLESLPEYHIIHVIERLFVYIAWARGYDYIISPNPTSMTAFVDHRVLNIRHDTLPNTYVNFDHIGGIKGALKYLYRGPGSAIKYIIKRLLGKRQIWNG